MGILLTLGKKNRKKSIKRRNFGSILKTDIEELTNLLSEYQYYQDMLYSFSNNSEYLTYPPIEYDEESNRRFNNYLRDYEIANNGIIKAERDINDFFHRTNTTPDDYKYKIPGKYLNVLYIFDSTRNSSRDSSRNPSLSFQARQLFNFGTDNDICAICFEEFEGGKKLKRCTQHHKFHAKCFNQWIARNPSCPLCRSPPHVRRTGPKSSKKTKFDEGFRLIDRFNYAGTQDLDNYNRNAALAYMTGGSSSYNVNFINNGKQYFALVEDYTPIEYRNETDGVNLTPSLLINDLNSVGDDFRIIGTISFHYGKTPKRRNRRNRRSRKK